MLKPLPKVKSFATRKEWEAAAWREFVRQCAALDAHELQKVLQLVTSPHERRVMTLRAAVIPHLQSDAKYRDIGRELWVSPQMISAIKKGMLAQGYVSNWGKAKAQRRERVIARVRKYEKRPLPKRHYKTKYGTVSM